MMPHVLWVAIGGALGSAARFGVVSAGVRLAPNSPLGTVGVNFIGSLAIGALLPILATRGEEWLRPLLIAGFLGGFTTMSSFASDLVMLGREGRIVEAILYWAAGAVACPLAAALTWAIFARPAAAA